MNIVGTLSHASTLKRMRTQQKTSSAQCNTHVGDLLDGAVLIPYTECLWNNSCLPNCRFCTKWAHSANVCDPLLFPYFSHCLSLNWSWSDDLFNICLYMWIGSQCHLLSIRVWLVSIEFITADICLVFLFPFCRRTHRRTRRQDCADVWSLGQWERSS